MAETEAATNTTETKAAETAATPPAQPGGNGGAPQQGEFVSAEQVNRWKRAEQQAAGSRAYFEAGSKLGIKSPEDFARVAARMNASAPTETSATQTTPKSDAVVDEDAIVLRASEHAVETMRRAACETEHERGLQAQEALVEESVKAIVGDTTGPIRDTVRRNAIAILAELRQNDNNLYPDGHPLRTTKLPPVSRSVWMEKAMPELQKIKSVLNGTALAAVGDAARRSVVQTPAGGQGQSGNIPADDPHKMMTREEKIRLVSQILARRSGAPVTAA